MTTPKDDLGAVRLVVEALEGFPAEEQERILRWAREKVGLSVATTTPSTATPLSLLGNYGCTAFWF